MPVLLGQPLFYIFFIYGVSFLVLAYLVAKGVAGSQSIPMVRAFNMLALFGLAHGITEITDWVRFIRKTLGAPEMAALTWLSQVCLIVSFVVLLQFAMNLFAAQSLSRSATVIRWVPVVALIAFAIVVAVRDMTGALAIGLLGRYTFGFASALLAAIALGMTSRTLAALGDRGLVVGMSIAAVGFACYAAFGGLIVKPIGGIPIQLFRSACAVTIAVSSFSLIRLSNTVVGSSELDTATA